VLPTTIVRSAITALGAVAAAVAWVQQVSRQAARQAGRQPLYFMLAFFECPAAARQVDASCQLFSVCAADVTLHSACYMPAHSRQLPNSLHALLSFTAPCTCCCCPLPSLPGWGHAVVAAGGGVSCCCGGRQGSARTCHSQGGAGRQQSAVMLPPQQTLQAHLLLVL
jgi:hypothetical protein